MTAPKFDQRYQLLAFQIIAHAALVYALFTFSAEQWAVSFFVYFLTGCLGVSVTFHRYLAHKSWKAPRWWVPIGSILGFWGLAGSPLAWSNNHIAHHKYADTERDPHSPLIHGFTKVQWLSMLTSFTSFRFATSNATAFQVFLHRNYFVIHTVILLALLLAGGIALVSTIYLVPAAILWNFSSFVNTINHSKLGYRNFETRDQSVNNPLVAVLAWGEGWHNNHHAYPGKSSFKVKWWEIDISGLVIKLIKI